MSEPSARLRKIKARERKAESPIEEHLGRALAVMGVPYLRQEPVGPYFADMYIPDRKTVVECDGREYHFDRMRDDVRDDYMTGIGLRVIRVEGLFIHRYPHECAAQILKILDQHHSACVVYLNSGEPYKGTSEEEDVKIEKEIRDSGMDWDELSQPDHPYSHYRKIDHED